MKFLILALLIVFCFSRNYPMYKQCDSRWGSHQLGTSSQTICSAGCLMSSAAMALSGWGHGYTPDTLNTWLKSNGGYVSGDLFVWASITKLGLTYKGIISNDQIRAYLDKGYVVIINVHGGRHWVLATGYSGVNILVNDPGFSTTSYAPSEIVTGQTHVYSGTGIPNFFTQLMMKAQNLVGIEQPQDVQSKVAKLDNNDKVLIA